MLHHFSPTFLLIKQLRSSQITSLPTACISKALIAHSLLNFYLFLLKIVTLPLTVGFINRLMAWLWVVLRPSFCQCPCTKNHGFTIVLLFSNLFCINVTSMTAFFFSDPWTMYLFSSTILTSNTLTFLLHPNWKRWQASFSRCSNNSLNQ